MAGSRKSSEQIVKRALLPFTVFLTGACVLVIEIVAMRILAPYFGNTIYSVSSVISVVLAALSVGYWFGGRLADRHPSKQLFFTIVMFSGIAVLGIQVLQSNLLLTIGYSLPLTIGPLIVSCVLFFLPSFILGMLSPFAIALQQIEAKSQGVGTTTGQMFFFSTIGSIMGSLLTGFVLIPQFGITAIMLGVGVVLFLLGLLPLVVLGSAKRLRLPLLFMAFGVVVLSLISTPTPGVVYARDGVYERITIFDSTYKGHPTRFLMQDSSHSAAMFLDSSELAYNYSKYLALHELFTPQVNRALVIGGGAYSIPKALLQDLPQARVDVAEIEPSLPKLAQKYFKLPQDPRLTHYIEDGRRMLHDTPGRYDLIFSDVYHSLYSIPTHFTTLEFMQQVRDRLSPGGVFMANLIGSLDADGPSFVWSEVKTMQQVFPEVYLFAVDSPGSMDTQNIIAVGSTRSGLLEAESQSRMSELLSHQVDITPQSLAKYDILTDDYAPVDYLTSKVLPKR